MARIDPRNALPVRIAAARLALRAPIRGDVALLTRLANNANISKWLARLPHPYTSRHALDFVERIALLDEERVYAITLADDGLAGVASFHFAPGRAPELGYWLGEPHWGKGLATEAVRALVDAAHKTGQFPLIEARVLAENAPSRRVLEKAGFKPVDTVIGDCGEHKQQPIMHFRLEQPRWM